MIRRRRLITTIIGILLLAGCVRADMVPIGHQSSQQVCNVDDSTEIQLANGAGLYDRSILDDLNLGTPELQLETKTDNLQPVRTARSIELSGGPDSVSLCLYALMGLGLCSAPHWIKRLHFGHLPEWYHDGAPFQIGHSFAATPESLCSLQICYFDPPNETAEDFLPQYRQRDVISLWRKSQYTPDAIASRGPPLFS